jgi:medium-chain acyl-[acyl-carrier-protein] hydrolase
MEKAEARCGDIVICRKPNSHARLRLFCFPFAGGGASTFNSWVDELPPDIALETELLAIQLPGRHAERTEHLPTRLPSLLDALMPCLRSFLNMPFVFFGHSMGALVSFELARELRRHGMPGPVHLVVSGHRAPHLPDPHPQIHELADAEFLARVQDLGGTPDEILQNPELVELFLPALRADFAVCETYCYAPEGPLDCSITAFGGNADPKVNHEELAAWQVQSSKSFSLRMFPGAHFYLLSARMPLLLALAQDLKHLLRRLPAGPH